LGPRTELWHPTGRQPVRRLRARGPRLSVDAQLELDVAFADGDSPVYDENVPDVLLELREYVAELVGRFEPRFG